MLLALLSAEAASVLGYAAFVRSVVLVQCCTCSDTEHNWHHQTQSDKSSVSSKLSATPLGWLLNSYRPLFCPSGAGIPVCSMKREEGDFFVAICWQKKQEKSFSIDSPAAVRNHNKSCYHWSLALRHRCALCYKAAASRRSCHLS